MKQPRVNVNAHAIIRRGLLLIYGCVVFGDTSENINRVLVRAFLFSSELRTKFKLYKGATDIPCGQGENFMSTKLII